MTRTAPYHHADGTNCWTVDCSRGHKESVTGFQAFVKEWSTDPVLAASITESKPSDDAKLELAKLLPKANRIRRGLNKFLRRHETDWELRSQMRNKYGEKYNALSSYMQYDYLMVNSRLRGGKAWAEFLETKRKDESAYGDKIDPKEYAARADEAIGHMDYMLEELKTISPSEHKVLYRYEFPYAGDVKSHVENFKVGDVIDVPAFTSTSPDPNVMIDTANESWNAGKDFYVYEIVSNRGLDLYKVAGNSGVGSNEREVLLPRNSRLQVHRILEAPYETSLEWHEQQLRGYFGYKNHERKPVLKKRLHVVQLIDVTG
jgi:hypothetical protein